MKKKVMTVICLALLLVITGVLTYAILGMVFGHGNNAVFDKSVYNSVTDDMLVGDNIRFMLRAYSEPYEGMENYIYSLAKGDDGKDYYIHVEFAEQIDVTINTTLDVTGVFAGKEYTGRDEEGYTYADIYLIKCVLN